MDSNLSASDIALLNNGNGFGGNNSFFWIFALIALMNGGFGGWGRNDFGNYTSAQTQEILFGQQFQNLDNKMDRIGNGIADSTYALNEKANSVQTVLGGAIADTNFNTQKNVDALRFDMSNYHSDTNAVVVAQTQKVLDAISQNKIDSLQAQVSELKTQNMFCGIPRINPYGYGVYPYSNGCGCNCGNM